MAHFRIFWLYHTSLALFFSDFSDFSSLMAKRDHYIFLKYIFFLTHGWLCFGQLFVLMCIRVLGLLLLPTTAAITRRSSGNKQLNFSTD